MSEQAGHREDRQLVAYRLFDGACELRAGEAGRAWMDDTPARMAYFCLPLSMANQSGWDILCPATFAAFWTGDPTPRGVRITFKDGPNSMIRSHFGSGIVTIASGYLFRTPPGHNLWVKAPPNRWKDGVSALEGVVETDWGPYTFTINWKITRKNFEVRFEKGEPLARIVPIPRGYVQSFKPEIRSIEEEKELFEQYREWQQSRAKRVQQLFHEPTEIPTDFWDLGYLRGIDRKQQPFPDHETQIKLREFDERKQP